MKITKIESDIFYLTGTVYYGEISSRLAFNSRGVLTNYAAQRLDRARGLRYIVVNPVSINGAENINRAHALNVGESFEFSI